MKQFIKIITIPFSIVTASICHAEIITDGTVGQALSLNGPNYTIDQQLGTQVGNNLFHSFQSFNLHSNNGISETATFTGSSTIENVISRVTGGEISTINGLLKSEIGNADFYFLNPAGIVFGANAKVDVPAAFHVSTADQLEFNDGSVFSASDPQKSSLGMAKPEAFGFLEPQFSNLVINGSVLEFKAGSEVTLSSDNIKLDTATISNEAGLIKLAAQNDITANSSLVNVSGDGAGQLDTSANSMSLHGSHFWNSNTGSKNAQGSTEIQVKKIQLDNGSQVSSGTFAQGNGANIDLYADELIISGSKDLLTGIGNSALSGSLGNSGKITINVNELLKLENGAEIQTSTYSQGDAGELDIKAKDLIATGVSFIGSASNNSGNAGAVKISADNHLYLQNSFITSNTYATGDSGLISIQANKLELEDNSGIYNSVSVNGSGKLNDTTIQANTIQLDYSEINSVAVDSDAGNINIIAQDSINLNTYSIINSDTLGSGSAGDISVYANKQLILQGGSAITSSTKKAEGNAGSINIDSGELNLFDKSIIASIAFDSSNGLAGKISINSVSTLLDDSGISIANLGNNLLNETESSQSSITINSDNLLMQKNSSITAVTYNNVNASNINLMTNDQLTISNSYITNDTFGSGNAGNIRIISNGLININNSYISNSTHNKGNAGSIDIQTEKLIMDNGASIFSSAHENSSGLTGKIDISSNQVYISEGGISISHYGKYIDKNTNSFTPGLLNIETDKLILNKAYIVADSYGNTPASSILLQVGSDIQLSESVISSLALKNNGGNISIVGDADISIAVGIISTEAIGGNGGSINISGNGTTILQKGRITTATAGGNGGSINISKHGAMVLNNMVLTTSTNGGIGGDISINTESLTMDTGFIQANTTQGAKGGDISISTPILLTRFAVLPEIGGTEPQEYAGHNSGINIIQAAAPEGNPGTLTISTPEMDTAATLAVLSTDYLQTSQLRQDPCAEQADSQSSSLLTSGRGGLPKQAKDPSAVSFGGTRLENLLDSIEDLPKTSNRENKQYSRKDIQLLARQNSNYDCQQNTVKYLSRF